VLFRSTNKAARYVAKNYGTDAKLSYSHKEEQSSLGEANTVKKKLKKEQDAPYEGGIALTRMNSGYKL
jgi:hypothetical protein